MLRFSLATLFCAVLMASIGTAALVNANELWRQLMVTCTIALLLLATLIAVTGRDATRRFAIGFAVIGWIYLALSFVGALELQGELLTERASIALYSVMHPPQPAEEEEEKLEIALSANGNRLLTSGSDQTLRIWDVANGRLLSTGTIGTLQDFVVVGRALWVILMACLGGAAAKWIGRPRRE